MSGKRSFHQDPEYDAIPAEVEEKRMKLIEEDVRKQTKKKIEVIIKSNFDQEIAAKDAEIQTVDELLHEGRSMIDRLRACIITKFYATLGQEQSTSESIVPSVHPTIKPYVGKSPKYTCTNSSPSNDNLDSVSMDAFPYPSSSSLSNSASMSSFSSLAKKNEDSSILSHSNSSNVEDIKSCIPRFKTKSKIVIGNVSKFIPAWRREEYDQSTHKWMVYVRGEKNNSNIESFVKKVRFLLHPSYRPNDVVEVSHAPFHLIKRGWGEFPVRVQLHFHDNRNKPVDIIHSLKLDKTYTGLQTLGSETVVELTLFKVNDTIPFEEPTTVPAIPFSNTVVNNTTCNAALQTKEASVPFSDGLNTVIKHEVDTSDIFPPSTTKTNQQLFSQKNTQPIISFLSQNPSTSILNTNKQSLLPKPIAPGNSTVSLPLNGVNTYIKCTDSNGRILLVPQSSFIKQEKTSPAKINTANTSNFRPVVSNTSVPSYMLKLVPNQETGQSQVVLIPMPEKKILPPNANCSKSVSLLAKNGMSQEKVKLKGDSKLKSEIKSHTKKADIVPEWEKRLNCINLSYHKTYEEVLKRIAVIFPLVKESVDRTIDPYCASSIEEYQRWNIGKQRSAEWQRAGLVLKASKDLLAKKPSNFIKPEDIWPRKTIMLWCRKNGLTPMTSEKNPFLPEPEWSGEELCSLNDAQVLVSTLKEEKSHSPSSDEEIDILTETKNKPKSHTKTISPHKPSIHLPYLTAPAAYVKDVTSHLSVRLKPLELEPNINVPVIEEMMLAACKNLVTDLIGSAVSEGFKRMGGKLCPEEITISDVYSAVKKTPKFDFLTNSFLGIPQDSDDDT